ncbi:MAG TPA: hypothetical protein VFA71_01770, partial [Terriglobales bacterium]|nr:hypothetical protein [Terriglobales bacterium]
KLETRNSKLTLKTRNLKLLLFCLLSALPLCGLDRNAFSFAQYDLQAQIDPATHGFGARGKIVLRNDSGQPQKNAALQISSSLEWKSIQINGKDVLHVTHSYVSDVDHTGELSEAVLTFPQEIPPQSTVELEISYSGAIKKDLTRLQQVGASDELAAASDWDEVAENFSAVRGVGFVAWYPMSLDAVSMGDGSSYSLVLQKWKNRELTSQFKLQACTTSANPDPKSNLMVFGSVVQPLTRQVPDGKKGGPVLSCASFPEVKAGFNTPSFALGALSRRDLTSDGVDASILYTANQAQAAEEYAALMKPAQALTNKWFGKSRRAVVIVGLADAHSTPWESGEALFTPLKRNAKAAGLSLVHQFTHAAFPSPRLWIYEGLAHFAQALQRESQEGRAAALDYMALQLPGLTEDENENIEIAKHANPGPVSISFTSLIAGNDEVLYRSKAMYVWWMLRDMLGDGVLQHALAKYRAEEDTDPAYLQHLLEAEAAGSGAKVDLQSFFNDWVYRDRGLPDFRVASTYASPMSNSGSASGFLVTVTVENSGDAGAEVPVALTAANKETVVKRLAVPADGKASIRIPTQNPPQSVSVGDGGVPESDTSNNSANIQVENASH